MSLAVLCTALSGCSEGEQVADKADANAQIVGGFGKAAANDPDVMKAAEFAAAEESRKGSAIKLTAVTTAETQVVAGTNFKMLLSVDDSGKARTAEVVVYRDLRNAMSLTSWTWKE